MSFNTHGETIGKKQSPEYARWAAMIQRCHNSECSNFTRYGARGIKVCKRWMKFENFLADMGRRPSSKHSLERNDNNGDYKPSNCRWATKREQGRNTRMNRMLTCDGRTMTVADWADRVGVSYEFLYHRIEKGWTHERAIKEPRSQ